MYLERFSAVSRDDDQVELNPQKRAEESICSLWELCRIVEQRNIGCLVLDADRRVVLVGPLANRLLDRGGLRIDGDFFLRTDNPHHARALREALDGGLRGHSRKLVAIEREDRVAPLVLTVSMVRLHGLEQGASQVGSTLSSIAAARFRLRPGEPLQNVSAREGYAGYALWLRDPLWFEPVAVDDLMNTFGLTRREAELTLHLASGDALGQFAGDRKISMNTVKSHLKQAFLKLGVKTQAQLITTVHCLLR